LAAMWLGVPAAVMAQVVPTPGASTHVIQTDPKRPAASEYRGALGGWRVSEHVPPVRRTTGRRHPQ
jgi:hypothetical protein